jgi:hypothetical protein
MMGSTDNVSIAVIHFGNEVVEGARVFEKGQREVDDSPCGAGASSSMQGDCVVVDDNVAVSSGVGVGDGEEGEQSEEGEESGGSEHSGVANEDSEGSDGDDDGE